MLTHQYVCAAMEAMSGGQTVSSFISRSQPIKTVAILGASGNIGVEVVKALLSHDSDFRVTVITRQSSASKTQAQFASFPNAQERLTVRPVESYSSHDSLLQAFQGQDCVVSTLASFSVKQQKTTIDAAIAAGVKRFFPSEYGVDTSDPATLAEHMPVAAMKREIVEYLQTKSEHISWTALIVGAFFDWSLKLSGVLAFNLHESEAIVYDGGDVPYEATNLAQIGRAIAACISTSERVRKTANQYVYVNSFTVTQNQVIAVVNKHGPGRKWDITHVDSKTELQKAKDIIAANDITLRDFEPTPEKPYADGSIPMIWSAIFGANAGLNQYSRNRGLWNEVLGLPKEDLEETVKSVLEEINM